MERACLVAWLLFLLACGSGGDGAGFPSTGGSFDAGFADTGAGAAADAFVPSPDDSGLPPEVEETRDFEAPRGGARHVFVANPLRDTVAVIDSETLRIESVEAGDGPTFLETASGQDRAVVLNVGSQDATIIRTGDRGSVTSTVPVVPQSNAIAIAPDGDHAVVYFDASRPGAGIGTGSFQDVTVLTLGEDAGADTALDVSVGFRPSEVIFPPDSSAAFIVTEDGISVVRFADLLGPTIVPTISIGDSPSQPLSRDISITPDGQYALARREGSRFVRLIDLGTGEISSVDLGGPVTDLDLAPDGTDAFAIVRERSVFLRLPLPGAFVDSSTIEETLVSGQRIGSITVSATGDYALLYTTAARVERASIVELTSGAIRTIRLRKSIRAVAMAPSGGTALIVHQVGAPDELPPPSSGGSAGDPDAGALDAGLDGAFDGALDGALDVDGGVDGGGAAGDEGDEILPDFTRDPTTEELERQIDAAFGYSLVDLATGFTKLQLTDADVGPLAVVPDGTHAFALFRDDAAGIREVQRIILGSFRVERIVLGSPPRSIGVVGDTARVFVGQEHPEGRITFIEWATGESEAVTGFELNSRIVE